MSSYAPATTVKYCDGCGGIMDVKTTTCPHCLAVQTASGHSAESDKTIMPTFILCFLFGVFGAHRFYVGRTGSAIAQLCTLGGLGIWMLVDLIVIVTGSFTDAEGRKLVRWT